MKTKRSTPRMLPVDPVADTLADIYTYLLTRAAARCMQPESRVVGHTAAGSSIPDGKQETELNPNATAKGDL